MDNKNEIKSLTGIRGIAALYVALFHSLELHGSGHFTTFQNFINNGFLSVDIFFLLSGFVMTLSSKKYFEGKIYLKPYLAFMKKRFARLYPMYFIVLVFGFVFINHFSGRMNFIIGLTMLSVLFANGYIMIHLWSLSTEWVAYMVYPILLKICDKFNSFIWTIIVIACSLLLIAYSIQLKHISAPANGNFAIPPVPAIIRCLSDYLLGITCFLVIRKWPKIYNYKNLISVITLLLLVVCLFIPGSDVIVIVLFMPLMISISNDKSWVSKIMSSTIVYFLGLISYSLYLIHPIFLHFFKDKFYEQYNNLLYKTLIFNTGYLIVITLVAYILFKIIELPMQKILNNKVEAFMYSYRKSRIAV